MADSKSIELSIEDALALIQGSLPVLEAIPAIAPEAKLAELATSGAQLLTPVLFRLGRQLAEKGVTTEMQIQQLEKLQDVLNFNAPEWKPSAVPPATDAGPTPATGEGSSPPSQPG